MAFVNCINLQKYPSGDFLQNKFFKKFRNNHKKKKPVLEFLLNTVAGLKPKTLLKKTPTHAFSCEYSKIFRNYFFFV